MGALLDFSCHSWDFWVKKVKEDEKVAIWIADRLYNMPYIYRAFSHAVKAVP